MRLRIISEDFDEYEDLPAEDEIDDELEDMADCYGCGHREPVDSTEMSLCRQCGRAYCQVCLPTENGKSDWLPYCDACTGLGATNPRVFPGGDLHRGN